MAGRVPQRPTTVAALSINTVDDQATQRALDLTADAVQRLQAVRSRAVVVADLTAGKNVVRHGLGRAVVGYTLVPTVADATFAHAIDATNPHPELELWITVVGTAQPRARMEVW